MRMKRLCVLSGRAIMLLSGNSLDGECRRKLRIDLGFLGFVLTDETLLDVSISMLRKQSNRGDVSTASALQTIFGTGGCLASCRNIGDVMFVMRMLRDDKEWKMTEGRWIEFVDHLRGLCVGMPIDDVVCIMRLISDLPVHLSGDLTLMLCSRVLNHESTSNEDRALAAWLGSEIAHAVA
eukprot:GDKJ01022422.1.p1 GENE.GDKJ01022422.1~~GDKJ01022422.1.p1  ORF type:complete len:197 (-),score=5.67 GDKJ01022422.1:22-561(-)